MSDATHSRGKATRPPRTPKDPAQPKRRRTPKAKPPPAPTPPSADRVIVEPADGPAAVMTPEVAQEIRLARAQGVSLQVLIARYPDLPAEAIDALTRDQAGIQAAYDAAALAEGTDPAAGQYDPPACDGPAEGESLEQKADRLEQAAIDRALDRSTAKQAEVPEGKVAVVIPKSGPGVPETTIHMDQGDYDRLRADRAKGISLAELKATFNLPGQVVRAATAGVTAPPSTPTTPAAEQPTPAQAAQDGGPRKRGRAATHEEALTLAKRMAAGETAEALAQETGWAVSTMKTTLRWAKKEGLVTVAS